MRDKQPRGTETFERSLDSTLESVDSAEEIVVGMAQKAGFDEDDLMKIGMALRAPALFQSRRQRTDLPKLLECSPLLPMPTLLSRQDILRLLASFLSYSVEVHQ